MADDDLERIAEWWDLMQRRRSASALERDVWIAAARQLFAPGPREACCVCGKFKGISQAHHVIPLSIQYDRGFKLPDQEYVWLCPNHHAMVHLFIISPGRSMEPAAARARSRRSARLHPDLSEDEFDKMMELMRIAGRSPA